MMKMSKGTLFLHAGCFMMIASIYQSAWADYYVVYSVVDYATPPPVTYYQKQCTTVPHKKHNVHYKTAKKATKDRANVSVYYIVNQVNCGNGCHGDGQTTMMSSCQASGYKVFYGGMPVRHSDYYYMQGVDENAGMEPDVDGNTYDNDIY